ncbi:hypothetical protein H0E87_009234 [Populus deltoides]|uniref:Telomerase Cajal body protein 1 n=1 Tax=Populus deltoides TaxID=3696 RepID=A0A8T2Z3G1_POPDE|nr:hypothetical protein H0E87_009234 [Populus deltoides]
MLDYLYKNDIVERSPDGSCFLTSSEDNTLRLFSIPDNGSGCDADVCCLPTDEDPVSCVFATTTLDHPIHLWDATSGLLRCTYRAYDAVDEITAAISLAFNPAGTKIFAGYNKSIRIFDIHRPGRDFAQYSTTQGNKEGQPGIISAVAFSSTHTGMLATGSYNQTNAIYREDSMELLYILYGQEGGITHVQFSQDGNYLYTGGRKEALSNMEKHTYPLYDMCFWFIMSVQLRHYFHIPLRTPISCSGMYGKLLKLCTKKCLSYDLQNGQWISGFHAATDTVNGFSFHPFLPMAVSSSGHRRFQIPDDCDENLHLTSYENCASVWSFSCASMEEDDTNIPDGDFTRSENEILHQDH